MKYVTETGAGAMIYIPSFIKTGSNIRKLTGGHTDTNIETGCRSRKSTFIYLFIFSK
jgi:hypothetical protein